MEMEENRWKISIKIKVLVGNLQKGPSQRSENNIKMDLQETGAWTAFIWLRIGINGMLM
jgi:hypothetical protein